MEPGRTQSRPAPERGNSAMSWRFTAEGTTSDIIANAEVASDKAEVSGSRFAEVEQQIQAALFAASELIQAVSVDSNTRLRLQLSGHANEGHRARLGFSADTITVSITQTS